MLISEFSFDDSARAGAATGLVSWTMVDYLLCALLLKPAEDVAIAPA